MRIDYVRMQQRKMLLLCVLAANSYELASRLPVAAQRLLPGLPAAAAPPLPVVPSGARRGRPFLPSSGQPLLCVPPSHARLQWRALEYES